MGKYSHSFKVGISFGLSSGVITTLGLMIGLYSGSHSQAVVLGGILTIAIADALSDALGIHISEEAENVHNEKEIWIATLATFFSKFICAISFSAALFILDLKDAIIADIVWGMLLIGVFSYFLSDKNKSSRIRATIEHLLLAVVVIILSHFSGALVNSLYN